nr:reverse transcriptase domain-containing protein [Tanacetum cinerariifolium]
MTRQKVTQSFARVEEITFPPLATSMGTEGSLVIEAKIGRHMIHRMYVDGGSSMEVLYEHCFNRLLPEIKSQMVSTTTSLTGFSGETIWPLGQLRLSEIATGGTLSAKGRTKLCSLLKENLDIFAWLPFDMTGVPRLIAKHRLNIWEGYSPRLVDKAFDNQVGRNIEVYIDYLVIKSHTEIEMLRDIDETFCTLRIINIKLNPKKCMFGAVEGMFLGGAVQTLVYFVSRALQGPELNYTPIEKLVLALVFAAKRAITKIERYAGRTQYHLPVEDIYESTDPSGFPCKEARRSATRYTKYEALTTGLRIATQMGVCNVYVSVDSKLVANQVLGTYVAKEENMIKYLEKTKSLVLVEVLKEKSIQEKEVATVVEEDGPTWMTPKMEYLKDETLPKDRKEADSGERHGDDHRQSGEEVHVEQHSVLLCPSERNSLGQQSHRTMIKSSHGDTPFSLTYGTEAVIPAEIEIPTYRTAVVDAVHNDEELWLNLDLLEERRKHAAIHKAKAKSKMTKYYNARVRGVTFRHGDIVYRSNEASHAMDGGKLGPKWEGPYEVTEALEDEVYMLRSMDETVLLRTWIIANLKKCYL